MSEKGLKAMRLLGQREAFAAVSGRCSAAEAEAIRVIHDEKLYLEFDMSWDDFCTKRLGASRRSIERILRCLREFGLAYFHMAQVAHVTPEEYRAIAPHVSEEGFMVDGAVIALLPENAEQVSAAVAELLEREKPAAKAKEAISFDAVLKRCEALEGFVREQSLEEKQRKALGSALSKIIVAASRHGILPRV